MVDISRAVVGALVALIALSGVGAAAGNLAGRPETLAERLASADDGETILLVPGVYQGPFRIDADITLAADSTGPVIFEVDGPGPAIEIVDADAHLSGLDFQGPGAALLVSGGSPLLEELRFENVSFERGANLFDLAVRLGGGTTAILRDSVLVSSGDIRVVEASSPGLEGNRISDGGGIVIEDALDSTIARDNTIERARLHGIDILAAGHPTVEHNTIRQAESSGIAIGHSRSLGVDPIVRGNTITDSSFGISVAQLAEPTVEANLLQRNGVGISSAVSDATFRSNQISDGGVGMALVRHAPRVNDNTIECNVIGLVVEIGTWPRFSGNVVCDNDSDVWLAEGVAELDRTDDRPCSAAG